MTRGPPPLVAIREAVKNAAGRGTVKNRDFVRESRIEFFIFCVWITVFVRIRRTPLHIQTPEDCAAQYKEDILWLRRVPLTMVTARELWLLSPWGTWQYFRVLDDRVIEIRADGVPFLPEDPGASGAAAVVGESLQGVSLGTATVSSGGES